MAQRLHIDMPLDKREAARLNDEHGFLVIPATPDEAEHVRSTVLALIGLAKHAADPTVSREQLEAEGEVVRLLLPVLLGVFDRVIPVPPGAKGGTALRRASRKLTLSALRPWPGASKDPLKTSRR